MFAFLQAILNVFVRTAVLKFQGKFLQWPFIVENSIWKIALAKTGLQPLLLPEKF